MRKRIYKSVIVPVSLTSTVIVIVGILIIFAYYRKREKPIFVKIIWAMIFIGMLLNIPLIILVKICDNCDLEQTESLQKDWIFQLEVM